MHQKLSPVKMLQPLKPHSDGSGHTRISSVVLWTVFLSTGFVQPAFAAAQMLEQEVPRPHESAYLSNYPIRYHRAIADAELEGAVGRAAREHRLQPALLLAVMKAESSFNPIIVSKAGAVGLMQLIPETAIRHGVRNLYDTEENVAGGARHLRYLLDRFHGNIRLALAAYNAGEKKVDRYGKIPPYKETLLYVQKVMTYYREYKKGGWVTPIASLDAPIGVYQAFKCVCR